MPVKVTYPDKTIFLEEAKPITIFLAGSINKGDCENWQQKVINYIDDLELITQIEIYNPRRESWSWDHDDTSCPDWNSEFVKQVQWELEKQLDSDIVFFYFDPKTKAPITMLELGIILGRIYEKSSRCKTLIVVCPDGFWKKANVYVTFEYFKYTKSDKKINMIQCHDLSSGLNVLIDYI